MMILGFDFASAEECTLFPGLFVSIKLKELLT